MCGRSYSELLDLGFQTTPCGAPHPPRQSLRTSQQGARLHLLWWTHMRHLDQKRQSNCHLHCQAIHFKEWWWLTTQPVSVSWLLISPRMLNRGKYTWQILLCSPNLSSRIMPFSWSFDNGNRIYPGNDDSSLLQCPSASSFPGVSPASLLLFHSLICCRGLA